MCGLTIAGAQSASRGVRRLRDRRTDGEWAASDADGLTGAMMAGTAFRYIDPGRTGLNIALFAVGFCALIYVLASGAPVPVLFSIGLFAAWFGYLVVLNPTSGLEIAPDEISFWQPWRRRSVPLRQIARVHLVSCTDTVEAVIYLFDGTTVDINSTSLPPKPVLLQALEEAGIAVTDG